MKLEVTGFEGVFDSIGKLKEELKPIPDSPLYNTLKAVAEDIIDRLQRSLDEHTKSNGLRQSIAPTITVDGEKVDIVISANSYWKFINEGVNGLRNNVGSPYSFKTPFPNRKMADALREGIPQKGLTLPAGFKDYESYSYASAVKLKREGIKPNHFVDNVLTPEYLQFIEQELAERIGKIVTLAIE